MKSLLQAFFILIFSFFGLQLSAQEEELPLEKGGLKLLGEVPSLSEQLQLGSFIYAKEATGESKEVNPKHRGANRTVPGKNLPKGTDPLIAKDQDTQNRSFQISPTRTFVAHVATGGQVPSDPTGAVGPNHYVAAWNTGFRIFDKAGLPLIPEAQLSTLFPGNDSGDPIVIYDAAADRFLITQFEENKDDDSMQNGLNIAVSKGPNPVTSGWWIYTAGFETGAFPDYPKYSVWRDGYYVTANIETDADLETGATGKNVFVLEREKMLTGAEAGFQSFALPGLQINQFYSPQFFNVGYRELPSTGGATLVYMQDDAWEGVAQGDDHLKVWTVDIDWQNPSASKVSNFQKIKTAAFTGVFDGGGFSNLEHPGPVDLDVLQATIMNQAQYRAFPGYNSAVFNFVVNVEGDLGERAGIRWYELRQSSMGQPWSIYQEGTYTSPDGKNAFAASMDIDQNGNIGMGFSTVGKNENIALRFTGRFPNDPLGQMTVPQSLLSASTAVNPTSRYADYSHMTLDPVDRETFWFISENFRPELNDVVGVFKLSPDFDKDVQVSQIFGPISSTLTSREIITIRIRNAGRLRQGNFPVSYKLDDGNRITEQFTGSLAFNETADFSFAQTADLSTLGKTYSIETRTNLNGDQAPANDAQTNIITHLNARDVGITTIKSPENRGGHTASEIVSVQVENLGGTPQGNFEVYYSLNDGPRAVERFTGQIGIAETKDFNFTKTVDLNAIDTYTLTAGTLLNGDSNPENNSTTTIINTTYCAPRSDCEADDDGVTAIDLASLTIRTDCATGDGYTDNTIDEYRPGTLKRIFNLDVDEGDPEGTLQMGFGDSEFTIFIDLNDNGGFEPDELVSNGVVDKKDMDIPFTIKLPVDAPLGDHRMRVRGKDVNFSGDLSDPCGTLIYGRTNDYVAHVFSTAAVMGDNPLEDGNLVILEREDNIFDIRLNTQNLTEDLDFSVYNLLGQKLVQNTIEKNAKGYSYTLDMSYAASGIYVVRLGNRQSGAVKKILVK